MRAEVMQKLELLVEIFLKTIHNIYRVLVPKSLKRLGEMLDQHYVLNKN